MFILEWSVPEIWFHLFIQEVTKHRTVVNGELKVFDVPERVVFWFSSVDGISDEQLAIIVYYGLIPRMQAGLNMSM